MIHGGKCPKCEKTMAYITIQPVELRIPFSSTYHGLSYQCPSCKTVLSAGVDFLAQKTAIAATVVEELKKSGR